MVPTLGRERQVDLCEFEASLAYRVLGQAQSYTVKPCLKKHKEKKGALIMSNKDKHEILLGDFVPF